MKTARRHRRGTSSALRTLLLPTGGLHGGYSSAAQFRGAAIVNYFVWEADQYDFTVSALNAYTRSILEQSVRGWPGGLRWLHGEDEVPPARQTSSSHVSSSS